MDVLLPPLGNRPSPLQPQMPVKPERKTHIEPYEAEEDPDFSYDGFQVTRREYYAHMQEPAISFADGKLSINAVCLKKAPDVEYVQILVNREQKKLVIRPCAEDDWDSLKWCTAARKTKVITCRMFFAMIMDMMQWDPANRYKIIGKMIHHEDEYLFVFDLTAGTMYERETVVDENGKERRKTSRTPVYDTRDPFELLDAMHVVLEFSDSFEKTGLKGFCTVMNKTRYVVINGKLSSVEKRVVAAHEAGHLIRHASDLQIGAFKDNDIYMATGKKEREANVFAADFLIQDEDVLKRMKACDSNFFNVAKALRIPAPFFAFKLYSMVERGYAMRMPVDLDSAFLARKGN